MQPRNLNEVILVAMARLIWATAYAQAHDEGELDLEDLRQSGFTIKHISDDPDFPIQVTHTDGRNPDYYSTQSSAIHYCLKDRCVIGRHPFAAPQQDWMDIVPPTPIRALLVAQSWIADMVQNNKLVCIWQLAAKAYQADKNSVVPSDNSVRNSLADYVDLTEDYVTEFGHGMAMMIMGSGVSWFDDHANFELDIPHHEAPMWEDLKD